VRCFVVAGFLLTSASRGPSAIAEPLVLQRFCRGAESFLQHFSFNVWAA